MLSYNAEFASPPGSPTGGFSPTRRTSIILKDQTYKKPNRDNAIKLLLRSRNLYQAVHDIRKLLEMMLLGDDMYFSKGGMLQSIIEKYEEDEELELTEKDENSVIRFLKVL